MLLTEFNLKLVAAAKDGSHKEIYALLAAAKAMHLSPIQFAESLSWAAHNGHTEAVKTLLESGATAEINAKDEQGNTALHWAAYQGHKATEKLLISYGADARILNNNLLTPAKFAQVSSSPSLSSAFDAMQEMGEELIKLTAKIQHLKAQVFQKSPSRGHFLNQQTTLDAKSPSRLSFFRH